MEFEFDLLDEFVEKIKEAYKKVSELKLKVKNKELNDIVTDADVFMEKEIISIIKSKFPDHSIYGEESGENKCNIEYEWLIDPIDGTINFASNIPLFATTIALRKNQETILGIIIDWSQNDVYECIKGKGAYCNKKPIKVSDTNTLNNSVISFCLTSHYNEEHINKVLEIEKILASKVRGLRLIVTAAIELAWCATGKIDGCFNVKPSIGLSSSAGKLLVEEAGGKVTNLQGNRRNNIDTMLVTNGLIHNEIVTEINKKK